MKRKKIVIIILIIIFIVSMFWLWDYLRAADYVSVKPAELFSYAQKENLSDSDYAYLLQQTGLGKPALDALRQSENCLFELYFFQEQMTKISAFQRQFMFFPTTTVEVLNNDRGGIDEVVLPELLPGDVFITRSTKTLPYRHGHAALVLDSNGTLAESMMIGYDSTLSDTESWLSYATLMILRPKNRDAGQQAVTFAKENLLGVPYHLLAGKSGEGDTKGTQCAHLVWRAYQAAGLDIDSDGGFLVTPCDIAGSDEFELVFCYGFGEDMAW